MALIKCYECGKEVSNQALACPNCGYPIKKQKQKQKQEQDPEKRNAIEKYRNINLIRIVESGRKFTLRQVTKKLYYILLVNDIPCTIYPEMENYETVKKWARENLNALEKITLNSVKNMGRRVEIAQKEYDIFRSFIEHQREEIKSEKEREEESKVDKREKWERKQKEERERIKRERNLEEIINSIKSQENIIPKCPNCGSRHITNIGTLNRAVSIGLFGLASSKIGKTKQCKSCGYKW